MKICKSEDDQPLLMQKDYSTEDATQKWKLNKIKYTGSQYVDYIHINE